MLNGLFSPNSSPILSLETNLFFYKKLESDVGVSSIIFLDFNFFNPSLTLKLKVWIIVL